MFERLEARVTRAAEACAAARRQALAAQLRKLMPADVAVETVEDGVQLSGRGLRDRVVLDASLRWTIAGLLK